MSLVSGRGFGRGLALIGVTRQNTGEFQNIAVPRRVMIQQVTASRAPAGIEPRSDVKAGPAAARQPLALLILFLAPWMFDYRADPGVDVFLLQTGVLVISLFAIALQSFAYRCVPISKQLRLVILLFSLWLSGAVVVGLARGQEPFRIAVVSLPAILFFLATIFTYRFLSGYRDLGKFRNTLLGLLVSFAVWRVYLRLGLQSMYVEGIRYMIIPATSQIFSAYLVACAFSRIRLVDIAGAIIHFGVILISVTRTEFVTLAAMVVLSILRQPRAITRIIKAPQAIGILAGVAALVAFAASSENSIIENWVGRLFSYEITGGVDLTGLLRIGEADFQFTLLGDSLQNMLIGLGLTERVAVSDQYLGVAALLTGLDRSAIAGYENFGFIDCQYSSLVFTGGIIFGGAAIIASVWLVVIAIISLASFVAGARSSDVHFIGMCGALGVVGFTLWGITNGIFYERTFSVAFGFCVGMMMWARDRTVNSTSNPARTPNLQPQVLSAMK